MNAPMFTSLAGNAKPEEIVARIHAVAALVKGGRERVRARIESELRKDWPDLVNPGISAEIRLKEIIDVAEGRRGISQFLRRFLHKPFVWQMIDELHPAYEHAALAKNADDVAAAAKKGTGKITSAPERAVFKKRGVQP